MSYADIVATIALLAALVSLGWQIYTWLHKKKCEETPVLKVFVMGKEEHNVWGKLQYHRYFTIKNIGVCGFIVLDCTINNTSIDKYSCLVNAGTAIIGAKVEPQNSACCQWCFEPGCKIRLGDDVKLSYKSDTGKTYKKVFTLYEE